LTDPLERHGVAFEANEALWDAWTRAHTAGTSYDLEGFKTGGIRLRPYDIEAIGDVHGRTLLHLQCHFGLDTLSWARLGAKVTGVDLSPVGIDVARRLAVEIGFPDARFVRSNLYDLPANLEGEFDIVYTSRGAINWLPDIRAWARVVAHFLAPGGLFYIFEAHPISQVFENVGVEPGELRLTYPYWEHAEPLVFPVVGSYAEPTADVGDQTEFGWDHGLGEIVTALIDAGLRIESLIEYPFVEWSMDYLVETPGEQWRLPAETGGELPLSFAIKATKPAAA
jgi:SAM-dependent methyltransferase